MTIAPRDSFAVIGGSGAHDQLQQHSQNVKRLGPVPTPFGLSGPLYRVRIGDARFLFLPRHGETGHEIAAPWVNYRANIYALKEHGISRIWAWSGPRALDNSLNIGDYVLPNDLIDDTRGRESTFYKGTGIGLRQQPVFCLELHDAAVITLSRLRVPYRPEGIYLCTQGPRLETQAEVRRYRDWRAHLAGMTLAPEAFLARELEICYHPLCYVTSYAEGVKQRGVSPGESMEELLEEAEREATAEAIGRMFDIAAAVSRALPDERQCPCALAMEQYRSEGRIGEDWHTWIGKP